MMTLLYLCWGETLNFNTGAQICDFEDEEVNSEAALLASLGVYDGTSGATASDPEFPGRIERCFAKCALPEELLAGALISLRCACLCPLAHRQASNLSTAGPPSLSPSLHSLLSVKKNQTRPARSARRPRANRRSLHLSARLLPCRHKQQHSLQPMNATSLYSFATLQLYSPHLICFSHLYLTSSPTA